MSTPIPFGGPVDHGKFQNLNFVVEAVASLPTAIAADQGRLLWLSTDGNVYVCDASPAFRLPDARNASTAASATTATTATTAGNATNLNGQPASFYTNLANTTGQRDHTAISDWASAVAAFRLDQFAAPTSALNINSMRLTAVGAPTTGTDAATKTYVDTSVQAAQAGIDVKANVMTVALTNTVTNGLATINGYTPVAGDRVLLTAQTTATENGPWIASSGSWARPATQEVNPGALWYVQGGNSHGTSWIDNNTTTVVVGTTAVSIVQFAAQLTYNGSTSIGIDGSRNITATAASGGGISTTSGIAVDTTVSRSATMAVTVPGSGTAVTMTSPYTPAAGRRLHLTVYRNSDNAEVMCYKSNAAGSASFTLDFGVAPTSGQYSVEIRT